MRPENRTQCPDGLLLPGAVRPGKIGRPRAIPQELVSRLSQRHKGGEGFRLLSKWLRSLSIDASAATCRRAVLGLPPYQRGDSTRTL